MVTVEYSFSLSILIIGMLAKPNKLIRRHIALRVVGQQMYGWGEGVGLGREVLTLNPSSIQLLIALLPPTEPARPGLYSPFVLGECSSPVWFTAVF